MEPPDFFISILSATLKIESQDKKNSCKKNCRLDEEVPWESPVNFFDESLFCRLVISINRSKDNLSAPVTSPVLSGSSFGHVSRIGELAPIFSFTAVIILGWWLHEYLSVYGSINKIDSTYFNSQSFSQQSVHKAKISWVFGVHKTPPSRP